MRAIFPQVPDGRALKDPALPEPESATCGGTSHILPAERAKATFDVQELTYVGCG